ncbi:MAG: glutathione S-transferase [Caulobacteraceae bacterium]|nr:glutathione S-transferase [Caulobacteraceae bacterium]
MITIYNFNRGARGERIVWQCEEMGLAYRAIGYEYPTPADFRAKYPPGSVPFLEDEDGAALGESIAIMLYLAERHGPTSLLPKDPAKLARTLQITVAAEASLGGLINPLLAAAFVAPADQKTNWTASFCRGQVTAQLDYLESLLGEGGYLVGDDLTLADIAVVTALGMWQGPLKGAVPPRLAAHRDRMMLRPAYQKSRNAFAG